MANILSQVVGTVNMSSPSLPRKRPYHHGDLRNAMVEAAVAVARRDGPDAVVVRDIARQLGVSHNAGYRHFAGREELLDAVADFGLRELAERMRAGVESVPTGGDPGADPGGLARRRLRTIGRAYVRFAWEQPGLFRAIWAAARTPPPVGGELEAAITFSDPYALLNRALDELVTNGAMPADRRPYSEIVAWSAVHGLAGLVIDGPLALLPAEESEAALERLLDVIQAGL
jgi:AcrR family transcriptional regulator